VGRRRSRRSYLRGQPDDRGRLDRPRRYAPGAF
jgi:hypothetical protein